MVSAHSDLDDAGEIVTPTPRVKRILSSTRCLPHIAQVMPFFFSIILLLGASMMCLVGVDKLNQGSWFLYNLMALGTPSLL